MTDLAVTDDLFFTRTGMDRGRVEALVGEALARHGRRRAVPRIQPVARALALRRRPHQERLLRHEQGFGLRAVAGEAAGYAHASELSRGGDPPRRARRCARSRPAIDGTMRRAAARHQPPALYRRQSARRRRLRRQDQAARRDRRLCPRPRTRACARSSASLGGVVAGGADHPRRRQPRRRHPAAGAAQCHRSWSARATAWRPARYGSRRPRRLRALSRSGATGSAQVDEALRQALVNLGSVPAPAGEMTGRARPGLARRHAARGGRPRARRRFQPQEDLGLRRADGPARRLAGRHRGR